MSIKEEIALAVRSRLFALTDAQQELNDAYVAVKGLWITPQTEAAIAEYLPFRAAARKAAAADINYHEPSTAWSPASCDAFDREEAARKVMKEKLGPDLVAALEHLLDRASQEMFVGLEDVDLRDLPDIELGDDWYGC
jgi:hypothetical protein